MNLRPILQWSLVVLVAAAALLAHVKATAQIHLVTWYGFDFTANANSMWAKQRMGANYNRNIPWSEPPLPYDARAGNTGIYRQGGDGWAKGRASLPIPGSNGRSVPVDVNAKFKKASAGRALAEFMKRPIPLTAGMMAAGLLLEMGLDWYWDSERGENVISQTSNPCVNGTCYEYGWAFPPYYSTGYFASKSSACQAAEDDMRQRQSSCTFNGQPCTWSHQLEDNGNPAQGATCNVIRNGNTNYAYAINARATTSPTVNEMSVDDLADAIANSPAWSEAMSRALREAIDAGANPELETPTVSGPNSVQGPKETTQEPVQKADGTPGTKITTKQTTYNIVYQGDKVTINTNITTSYTTNYQDGTTEQGTEKEEEKEQEPSPDVNDTELGEVPDLYEQKYPDGISGVWAAAKARIEATPLFQLPQQFVPTIGGSAGCPSWTLPVNVGIVNFGVHDASVPCWVWDFMRLVVIICALLLARRLIFGG